MEHFRFWSFKFGQFKKGGGVRLCPNFMEHFNVRFLNLGIFGILFLLTNVWKVWVISWNSPPLEQIFGLPFYPSSFPYEIPWKTHTSLYLFIRIFHDGFVSFWTSKSNVLFDCSQHYLRQYAVTVKILAVKPLLSTFMCLNPRTGASPGTLWSIVPVIFIVFNRDLIMPSTLVLEYVYTIW